MTALQSYQEDTMTDRSKFEQMLEHLVNEDQEAAKEIFHQIVVEKSRQIYENILSEDFDMEEAKDEDDEEWKGGKIHSHKKTYHKRDKRDKLGRFIKRKTRKSWY